MGREGERKGEGNTVNSAKQKLQEPHFRPRGPSRRIVTRRQSEQYTRASVPHSLFKDKPGRYLCDCSPIKHESSLYQLSNKFTMHIQKVSVSRAHLME